MKKEVWQVINADELLAECIRMAKALGIRTGEIDPAVRINSRATKRFGMCTKKGKCYTIEIAARLLDAQRQACMDVLMHEVLHTCYGCCNHGKRWKQYAQRVNDAYGLNVTVRGTCPGLGVSDISKRRYVITCQKCGKVFYRERRSRLVDHPEMYRCSCGGCLEVAEYQDALEKR